MPRQSRPFRPLQMTLVIPALRTGLWNFRTFGAVSGPHPLSTTPCRKWGIPQSEAACEAFGWSWERGREEAGRMPALLLFFCSAVGDKLPPLVSRGPFSRAINAKELWSRAPWGIQRGVLSQFCTGKDTEKVPPIWGDEEGADALRKTRNRVHRFWGFRR
jgi:hypothetical protein